jgi:hypothetical protein
VKVQTIRRLLKKAKGGQFLDQGRSVGYREDTVGSYASNSELVSKPISPKK